MNAASKIDFLTGYLGLSPGALASMINLTMSGLLAAISLEASEHSDKRSREARRRVDDLYAVVQRLASLRWGGGQCLNILNESIGAGDGLLGLIIDDGISESLLCDLASLHGGGSLDL